MRTQQSRGRWFGRVSRDYHRGDPFTPFRVRPADYDDLVDAGAGFQDRGHLAGDDLVPRRC